MCKGAQSILQRVEVNVVFMTKLSFVKRFMFVYIKALRSINFFVTLVNSEWAASFFHLNQSHK